MEKVRSDIWTHEEDEILKDIVVEHVREGSTRLNAFMEAGEKLGRTSEGCGFRWNNRTKFLYEAEIHAAEKERRRRKKEYHQNGYFSRKVVPVEWAEGMQRLENELRILLDEPNADINTLQDKLYEVLDE